MLNLLKSIDQKINGVIWTFVSTGIVLILATLLLVWTEWFVIKVLYGFITFIIAFAFLYCAYRIYVIKTEIRSHINKHFR